MSIRAVLSLSLLLAGCAVESAEPVGDADPLAAASKADNAALPVQIVDELPERGDPFAIRGASVHDRVIELEVTVRGCAQHDYAMVTDGWVFDDDPPFMLLQLMHDAHGDDCATETFDTVAFDVGSVGPHEAFEALIIGNGRWIGVDFPAQP